MKTKLAPMLCGIGFGMCLTLVIGILDGVIDPSFSATTFIVTTITGINCLYMLFK